MKLYALIKVAGNPKVKRYWQMLKRLYGGTDDTVKELKRTRDFGIYHGTSEESAKSILKDKMNNNNGNYFGDNNAGTYFKNRRKDGVLLRFKYPQELSKKQNYPNASSFSKFTDKDLIENIKLHRKLPFNKTIARIPLPIENMKNYRKAKYFGKLKRLEGNLMDGKFSNLENKQTFSNKDIEGNLLKII